MARTKAKGPLARAREEGEIGRVLNIRTGRRRPEQQRVKEIAIVLPPKHLMAQWPRGARVVLIAMAQFGVKKLACTAAGIHGNNIYQYKKRLSGFRQAWARAKSCAADTLEIAAYDRAINGAKVPVFYQGERVGYKREPSDLLLMFLLKGARPKKYRERYEVEEKGGSAFGFRVLAGMVSEIKEGREKAVIGPEGQLAEESVVDGEYTEVVDGKK